MKKSFVQTLTFCLMLLAAAWAGAAPMGTAFTYQGRLYEDGVPANGEYQIRFGLFDQAEAGSNLGIWPSTDPIPTIIVSGGLFTTTLDFGVDVFDGGARFLQIAVRKYDPAMPIGPMNPLSPRQELKPAPYALFAAKSASAAEAAHATNADSAATVPWGSTSLIGLPAGFADGVDNDTTYSAGLGLRLTGTTFSIDPLFGDGRYWTLFGNSGTDPNVNFLGTTDDRALTMRVNNQPALRLIPNAVAPNVVAGSVANQLAPGTWGVAISGGMSNRVTGNLGAIAGGNNNEAAAFASVAGGSGNQALGQNSAIGGGARNFANGIESNIGGGVANTNTANYATIGGGLGNKARGQDAVVAGGSGNLANSGQSTVGGGIGNSAHGSAATVAGGQSNVATNNFATVGGGTGNRAAGQDAVVAGGSGNTAGAGQSTVGGGIANRALSSSSTVAGGAQNLVNTNATGGSIAGGLQNRIEPVDFGPGIGVVSPNAATIAGGAENRIQGGTDAAIAGGRNNLISDSGLGSTILGGAGNQINAAYSGALGQGAVARAPHSLTLGKQFATAGDGQGGSYVATAQTAGNIAATIQGPRPTTGSAISFTGVISAKAFGDASAGFEVKGLIRNYGTEVALVGTPTVTVLGRHGITSATVTVDVSSASGGALIFRVQSGSTLNVRWVAHLQTAEVQF